MGFNIERVQPGILTPYGRNAAMDSILSNSGTEIDTRSILGQRTALNRSSIVQACVILRADAFSHLKIWAKDINGRKVTNPTVIEDLSSLNKFNEYQNWRTINNQIEAYAAPYGKSYVYKSKMIGLNKFNYYVVPNHMVEPQYSKKTNAFFDVEVLWYKVYTVDGNWLRLETDEIICMDDNDFHNPDGVRGLSRLYSLREPISTLLSIGEMSTQLIADGGARGIIGQGAKDADMISAPFLDDEKDLIQESLKQYGGLRGQLKYIVTKGAASYVPLTSKIIDMQLPELEMKSILQIGKRFGIPNAYFALEPRFKAMPEARKEFFTGTIIPEATVRYERIVKMKEIPIRAWEYVPDWSHLDFFQEALKESAIALNQALTALSPAVESGLVTKEQAMAYLEPYLE